MWLKLDDGFATHPKILSAGLLALALQIRAICYASQQHTDGALSQSVVPYLVAGFPTEVNWEGLMQQHGLWEQTATGYYIHDYLDWNMSREDYLAMKLALSRAGKKGMKHRWGKGKRSDNLPYNQGNNPVDNPPYNKTITLQSTSTSTLNALNSPDPEWYELLKKNPLYAHVDFARERGKMDVWKSQPVNRNRKLTQRFVIGWLNKIEPPLNSNGGKQRPPPPPPKNDPIGRGIWGRTYGDPRSHGYD